jgi:hypothetical protein
MRCATHSTVPRAGQADWARISVWTGLTSAAALVASTFGPAHGFWQRAGLTVGDVWIVVAAASLVAAGSRE